MRTEAGKRHYAKLCSWPYEPGVTDRPDSLEWPEARDIIDAIEAEARAQALEEVRAGVEGLNPAAFQKWWYGSVHSMLADDGDAFRASVLALLDRLSKGKDG